MTSVVGIMICVGAAAGATAPDRPAPVDRDHDGLTDRVELGATAAQRPALAPLTTALARRSTRPVRLLFLGSSTTYGVGASSAGMRYVDQVVGMLQRQFPSGVDGGPPVRDLQLSVDHPDDAPGVQGANGGLGGSTAATYFGVEHEYGLRVLQPTCVVHMIGSNDLVAGVPAALFQAEVEAVIRRIDSLSSRPPCHLLLQPVRRYQVSIERWMEYREALRGVALARPRVTFVDVGAVFEEHDALGADPEDLIGSDAVHLTDAGHTLAARTVVDALALTRQGLGTGTDPHRADTDRDGIPDGREVHGYVVDQRVVPCRGRITSHIRTRTLPYERDTDGDGISDRREAEGYRLADGRVVRTDASVADTDGDGRRDGREASAAHGDPVVCRGRSAG